MSLPRRTLFLSPGVALILLAFVVLIRSLSARNVYEIVLSVGALGVCLILGVFGVWGARRLAGLEPGWKPPLPLTANTAGETIITGFDQRIPWFFRIHFIVKGRFFPAGGQQSCPVSAETTVPRGSAAALLNLSFPLSGIFRGEGYCRLRDVFGLFSFSCGIVQHRTLTVRSAPCLKKLFPIDARSGAEDQRTKNATDEERYYMREYAPGDRFRDINWKSSERIDTLITRISPDNQEKVSRLEVYFRNFGPTGKKGKSRAALKDLWLLDRAKARLAQFLRTVKEEHASFVFHVLTVQDTWDISDQDELEAFLEDLTGLPFSPPQHEDRFSAGTGGAAGELYVFSTACDGGLSAFLLAQQPRPVSLFCAQSSDSRTPADTIERLYMRDFLAKGFIPSLRWLVFNPVRVLNLPKLPGNKTEFDYGEIGL